MALIREGKPLCYFDGLVQIIFKEQHKEAVLPALSPRSGCVNGSVEWDDGSVSFTNCGGLDGTIVWTDTTFKDITITF